MLEIMIASDNNQKEWMEYVNSKPHAHFYYDYRWKKALEDSFGHQCFYLMAKEGGKVSGVLPLIFIRNRIIASSLVSIPFLNYGGILADDKVTELFLLNKAISILKEVKGVYIEIRGLEKLDLPMITREHKVTMRLKLAADMNAGWQELDAKLRNQIRKAEKSGLTFKVGKAELLDGFYRVFCRNMRDLGTPVIGENLFKNILKYFPEETNIFIVEQKGKTVASSFTLTHKDAIEIPWASSIKNFNKLCPNEFMYWEVIKYAILKGLKNFDLGRCTKDSGTYRFKKQWAAAAKPLYWQYWVEEERYLPTDKPKESRFAPLIFLWRRLPLFVTNTLGPVIAKNIPIF
ncbi:MAG: FemAB family PEP-CTERM system-associated protein [Candidatus Omnitrophica bacterium]|nr:FemAB family PEP-CTERM system-associated protein [Candidatus Omnitrophota bacterium]